MVYILVFLDYLSMKQMLYMYLELETTLQYINIQRTRQMIRYRATATPRRLQIEQYTAQNGGLQNQH